MTKALFREVIWTGKKDRFKMRTLEESMRLPGTPNSYRISYSTKE